jgi:GT2 family glycosyltransferase
VIVNFRTAKLVAQCLHSLLIERQTLPFLKVAIAENDSEDGSFEELCQVVTEQGWQDWVEVIAVAKNRGFASGNNAAIEPALRSADPPDFFLLLNPDTTVLPGAVGELLAFLAAQPEVGIVGAAQQHPSGVALRSAFRFANPLGELDGNLRFGPVSKVLRRWNHAPEIPDDATETDWVSGGCMMVRRQVFADAGLMDEGYFLYFEEMDYCLRAKRHGWSTWFLPSARIVHVGGQSTGVTGIHRVATRRPRYWFDSRRRYYLKNYPRQQAVLADFLQLVGLCLWEARRVVQHKPEVDPPQFLQDAFANSVFVRGFELPGNCKD